MVFAAFSAFLATAAPAHATGGVGAPWRFLGIGPSQTTLRVLVAGAPCFTGATLNLSQNDGSVSLVFLSGAAPVGCSPAYDVVFIRLDAPLAGRGLVGAQSDQVPAPTTRSVPRVVGLSTGDAVTVLRSVGREARVVRRRTAPGLRRVLVQEGTRLVVSRPPR